MVLLHDAMIMSLILCKKQDTSVEVVHSEGGGGGGGVCKPKTITILLSMAFYPWKLFCYQIFLIGQF